MQILWLKSLSIGRKKLCTFHPLPQTCGGNSASVSVETRQRWRLSPGAGLRRPPLPHPVCNASQEQSREQSRSPLNLSVPLLGCPPFLLSSRAPTTSWGPPSCTVLSGAGAPRVRAWKPRSAAFLSRAHPSAALIGRSWGIPPPPAPGPQGLNPAESFLRREEVGSLGILRKQLLWLQGPG